MSGEKKRNPGLPLGTAAGAFGRDDECVYVPFSSGLLQQLVEFVYESPEVAHQALVALRVGLSQDEESARKLQQEYSIENLVEFLRHYLPRDGVVAVNWDSLIRLSASGLACLVADGEWVEIHVEDVLDREVDWVASGPNREEASSSGTFAYSHFGVARGESWQARARVSRSDGLELLFGDD